MKIIQKTGKGGLISILNTQFVPNVKGPALKRSHDIIKFMIKILLSSQGWILENYRNGLIMLKIILQDGRK